MFIPFLDKLEKDLPNKFENVIADAGYESEENYMYLSKHKQNSYIKPQNYEKSKNRKFKDISEDIYETFFKDIANNIEISLHTNGFLTSKNKNKRVSKAIY